MFHNLMDFPNIFHATKSSFYFILGIITYMIIDVHSQLMPHSDTWSE